MNKLYERNYHRLEEEHWWFRGRRQIVLNFLRLAGITPWSRILEVGCSGGPLIAELNRAGYKRVAGIDISNDAVTLCRERGLLDTHIMDAQMTRFDNEQFDLIIASDLLEHLERDEQALMEWNRLLKPRGALLIFVPAFQFLWSAHDEVNMHFRRYTQSQLKEALARSGFAVERSSYWNFDLFLSILIVRVLKRLLSANGKQNTEGDLYEMPSLLNRWLAALLRIENELICRGINLPFGLSVMALARKSTNTFAPTFESVPVLSSRLRTNHDAAGTNAGLFARHFTRRGEFDAIQGCGRKRRPTKGRSHF